MKKYKQIQPFYLLKLEITSIVFSKLCIFLFQFIENTLFNKEVVAVSRIPLDPIYEKEGANDSNNRNSILSSIFNVSFW